MKEPLSKDDSTKLKSAAGSRHDQDQECLALEKELRAVVLDALQDEKTLDLFFDEVTEVIA